MEATANSTQEGAGVATKHPGGSQGRRQLQDGLRASSGLDLSSSPEVLGRRWGPAEDRSWGGMRTGSLVSAQHCLSSSQSTHESLVMWRGPRPWSD